MRDAIVIFVVIVLSISIGGYLYLNGVPSVRPEAAQPEGQPLFGDGTEFTVIAEGPDAGTLTRRTNFVITTDEQLAELWSLIYGTAGPGIPVVDFTRDIVIAVFDGSHSTGGYGVRVTDIADVDGRRVVYILRESPGSTCATAQGLTSPFQIVRVQKTVLPIGREEEEVVNECP